MTTTNTLDTKATIEQSIRSIEAGAELIRITAPSIKEANNLEAIKTGIRQAGFQTPIVADIHFTPHAAEIAARLVEKVRINPGNFADKKKFESLDFSDQAYARELERIRNKFVPLIRICKDYGTAMRIGTNHGSLSDRIMSRFGDTAMGMVESALEFLRIARDENYHQIVLSMKSSNPLVMVEAYRLLARKMQEEFQMCYPLHLGVTEAGDGEDGRIKSALGIGTLLQEGLGDTIRVSLTEEPEAELPVCKNIIDSCARKEFSQDNSELFFPLFKPQSYLTRSIENIGSTKVPVVLSDFGRIETMTTDSLKKIGYHYDALTDKWTVGDLAADYIFLNKIPDFPFPGTLRIITWYTIWTKNQDTCYPYLSREEYENGEEKSSILNFLDYDLTEIYPSSFLNRIKEDGKVVLVLRSSAEDELLSFRKGIQQLNEYGIRNPVLFLSSSAETGPEKQLIHYATRAGSLFLDNLGNGILCGIDYNLEQKEDDLSRNNQIAFGILQAARKRISKTEYISCPSCGRTLFDLQETTSKIRAVTHHLKGIKIAIMGCIVNGPGEMADADFGYVGSGIDKITLYKGRDVVKRNIPAATAVDELILLLKENGVWQEPSL